MNIDTPICQTSDRANKPYRATRRSIRSYVRRESPLTKNQVRAWTEFWPLYGLDLKPVMKKSVDAPDAIKPNDSKDAIDPLGKPLDLDAIFGRKAEKVLEIGFGDGQSLFQMAKANPEKDFIGVEVYRTGVGNLLLALAKEPLPNLRILCADAKEILELYIPDNSLAGIQIFFADPWPKTRHHKRRLVQTTFALLIARKLKTEGQLHLATDWQDYAVHMMKTLSSLDCFQNIAGRGQYMPRPDFRPITKYEQRGLKLGHKTWDLIFKKRYNEVDKEKF